MRHCNAITTQISIANIRLGIHFLRCASQILLIHNDNDGANNNALDQSFVKLSGNINTLNPKYNNTTHQKRLVCITILSMNFCK